MFIEYNSLFTFFIIINNNLVFIRIITVVQYLSIVDINLLCWYVILILLGWRWWRFIALLLFVYINAFILDEEASYFTKKTIIRYILMEICLVIYAHMIYIYLFIKRQYRQNNTYRFIKRASIEITTYPLHPNRSIAYKHLKVAHVRYVGHSVRGTQ